MTDKIQQLREKILTDVSELFLVYGLRSTSMDDICTHLKISKKTLYQLFENKDDVVEQVVHYRRMHQRQESNVEELLRSNPVRFLYEIKKHIIHTLNSTLPANYFDIRKYHPEVDKRIKEEERIFIKSVLTEALTNGIREGYFRKDLDMDIQIYLFTAQMSFLGDPETMNAIIYPVPELITTIIDNFIIAISTDKGETEFKKIWAEENTKETMD